MNMIDRAWDLQHRIERHLQEHLPSEKVIVVICSFSTSMLFFWLAGNTCYSELDLLITYAGTLGLFLLPVIVYIVKNRNKPN